jgi:hypothetical protein
MKMDVDTYLWSYTSISLDGASVKIADFLPETRNQDPLDTKKKIYPLYCNVMSAMLKEGIKKHRDS